VGGEDKTQETASTEDLIANFGGSRSLYARGRTDNGWLGIKESLAIEAKQTLSTGNTKASEA
jgi:hypothetical protein